MAEQSRKKYYEALKMFLKIAIAAAVLIFLYCQKGEELKKGFAAFDYRYLLPALIPSLLSAIICSERWRMMAKTIGIRLKKFEAFSLTMQGMFFSLVIPGGAIGGDVVKMAAMSKYVQRGSRTEGVFSILMDRIVGMFALFLPSMFLLFYHFEIFAELQFPGLPDTFAGITIWWLLLALCAAGTAAGVAVFFHRWIERIPGIRQMLALMDRKSSGKVTRIIAAADIYARSPGQIFSWTLWSIPGVHMMPVFTFWILLAGTAGGSADINFMTLCTAVLIGNIAGLIPLFPGGIGVRDLVAIALLVSAGAPPETAGAVQLLSTGLMIIFNLSGSLFFIFDRKRPEANHE